MGGRCRTGDHVAKALEQRPRFLFGLALEQFRHQGRGCRGNGATGAHKTHVPNDAVLHFDVNRNLVSAEGIMAVRLSVSIFHLSEIPRTLVVVEDYFLIQIAQISRHENISRTFLIAATKASTSSRVL